MLLSIFKGVITRARKSKTGLFLLLGVLSICFITPQLLQTSAFKQSVLAESIVVESTRDINERIEKAIAQNSVVQAAIVPADQLETTGDWLQLNDRSQAVKVLQRNLKDLGYESVGRTVGLFDSGTDRAVRRFQRSEGLSVDGIVGPVTQAQLADRLGEPSGQKTLVDRGARVSLPPDIQRITERGTLIVSLLNRDNPPFFMEGNDDQLSGFDVKMAEAIASALDVDLEFRRTATTFNEVVDDVYALNADLAISKISRTLKRAKRTRFSKPYLNLRQGLLVNRVELAQASRSNNITETIRNLEGKIGVIKGSSYAGFAKQKFPKATIVSYANWPKVVEAVTTGEVMAAYRDELEVKKIVLSRPDAALQFQTIALTDTQDPLSIVLPWDSEHLLSFVDQYLEISNIDYTTDSLLKEYADYFET